MKLPNSQPEFVTVVSTLFQRADIAVGGISMTYNRMKDVDYLEPYTTSPLIFLVAENQPMHPILAFMTSFSGIIWVLILSAFVAYLIVIKCINKSSDRISIIKYVSPGTTNNVSMDVIAITLRQGKCTAGCKCVQPP